MTRPFSLTIRSVFNHLFFIASGALLLCYYGFNNRFPLTFSDTGCYLMSGIENSVPGDRSIIYGLFLRHISMAESLWLPMFLQAFILSYLLYLYFCVFSGSAYKKPLFLFFVFFVTAFTGVSTYASMLIPDVFTPVAILALGLLLLAPKLKTVDFVCVSLCLFLAIGTHNSHILIAAMVLIPVTVLYFIKPWRKKLENLTPKRFLYLWALILFTNLAVAGTHYAFGGGFTVTRGGHVFFLARLFEMELAREFLYSHCGDNHYELCAYKDSIPADFIWDPNSPIVKMGGWEATKHDYNRIIRDMMTNTGVAKQFAIKALESSFQQFFFFDTYVGRHDINTSPVLWPLELEFKNQLRQFKSSVQNMYGYDFTLVNMTQRVIVLLSLALFAIMFRSRIPTRYKVLALYILLTLYFNAAICGAFSSVVERYQGRVIWLLPLPVFLYLSNTEVFDRLVQKFTVIFPSKK